MELEKGLEVRATHLEHFVSMILNPFFSPINRQPKNMGKGFEPHNLIKKASYPKRVSCFFWSWKRDSNPRLSHYEWDTLPSELFQRMFNVMIIQQKEYSCQYIKIRIIMLIFYEICNIIYLINLRRKVFASEP